MYDKLSIINTALIRSGNNPVQFEGDGSAEWICGSDAYETELPLLLADHSWGFATSSAALTRVGESPDPRFSDAYAKPIGCLHLEAVWLAGVNIPYAILSNRIQCTTTGATVLPFAKFVATPPGDAWPPGFIEVLRQRVMSHIYRGLNEDTTEADKVYAASNRTLSEARTRADQESTPRAYTNSRLARARRRRRGNLAVAYTSSTSTPTVP